MVRRLGIVVHLEAELTALVVTAGSRPHWLGSLEFYFRHNRLILLNFRSTPFTFAGNCRLPAENPLPLGRLLQRLAIILLVVQIFRIIKAITAIASLGNAHWATRRLDFLLLRAQVDRPILKSSRCARRHSLLELKPCVHCFILLSRAPHFIRNDFYGCLDLRLVEAKY